MESAQASDPRTRFVPATNGVRPFEAARLFFSGSTFLPHGCFDPDSHQADDLDSGEATPSVQVFVDPPAQRPAPAQSLLLEYRDSQYVRIRFIETHS
jgi:hypothetical protein